MVGELAFDFCVLMLFSVTTCFNSSLHEFCETGSSQATRPSKIESILKLSNTNTKIVYSFFRKTILCKKKLLVAKQAVHNDSTNAEKRVVGKLSYIYRKPSKQEQDKTSNNTTYKQRNKENIKEKKKSSAYHGGMSNNFSQYCEKRTHQVAFIVLRFSPKCDDTN